MGKIPANQTIPSRTRQTIEIISPAGKGNIVTPVLTHVCRLATAQVWSRCVWISSQDGVFLMCREPPLAPLKSELCLHTPNTNRVYIKDFPPTVTVELHSHTLFLTLASLFSIYCPFLPLPLLPFSLSLSISHLLLVGGWSVTLLCAHWPVARWWFIAEEGRGFRRWGWWMARFKITCGGVWKRSMMNECDLWTPIKMVSLQRTVGFRSSQRFCAALSSSNDLFIASVLHSCVLG